ncbi:MAG: SBBP repeat-containing protein, partial [Candidatus Brocadiaceae bacterium]|nr:SBBP repeat-containing protein [Candidatus Brocadiaceae bacterium]
MEKLFCVKPGADPEQIKISLNGIQPSENPPPLSPSVRGTVGCPPLAGAGGGLGGGAGAEGLSVNEDVAPTFMAGKRQGNGATPISPLEKGAGGLSVNEHGELVAETALGTVKFTKPVAYQEINGKRVEVDCKYVIRDRGEKDTPLNPLLLEGKPCISPLLRGAGGVLTPQLASHTSQPETDNSLLETGTDNGHASRIYSFTVAAYDKTKDLIIDPLLASTFLGGSTWDYSSSLTLDPSGNVYVTGYTRSTDFPTTSGAYNTSSNGSYDVFVSKLNGGLTSLLASTFLGGSDDDKGNSLALDTSGNVYVTGRTYSTDFPTTSGAYDTALNGDSDVFVSKLDSGLTSLLASTYLGEWSSSSGQAIALDTSGNVYVAGGEYLGYGSVFVWKLDDALTTLLASNSLGGCCSSSGVKAIVLDTSGNVYVTGSTNSADFPTTSGAYDTSFNGGYNDGDVFISKLNGGLTSLLASTFLGGSRDDYGRSLTLDTSGNVYVTGWTWSTNFPTTSGAYDTSQNGYSDVFVSKLDGGLTSLLASTYLGGSGAEGYEGTSLTLDTSGNVYVTGDTTSTDFPTTSGAYDTSQNGYPDVFVSKLDSNLSAGTAQPPTVTTGDASDITLDSATLKGVVNANGLTAAAWFEYGTTSGGPYLNSNTQTVTGSGDTPVSIGISGLSAGTKYYYKLVAENSAGKSEGSEKSFTTTTAKPPTVTTGDASDITSDAATLNGVVNANGLTATAWFEYGATSGGPYLNSNTQTVTGSGDTPVSIGISGLTAGKKYYYRLVAENNDGKSEGSEKSFTTTTGTYELLEKYAPILYMHEDERYYPTKVEVMLENAELWRKSMGSGFLVDSTPTLDELMTKKYDTASYYLSLKTGWNEDKDNDFWRQDPIVYGRQFVDGDLPVLQYWFFYIYNDWDNIHEGDWEMIQIILNKEKNPTGITYSIHKGGLPLHWTDQNVSKDEDDNNHPLVYVTKGGHGSWNKPGDNVWYQFLKVTCVKCIDNTSDAGDKLYPDITTYTSKTHKYTLKDVSDSGVQNSEYHWIHWRGYWGDQLAPKKYNTSVENERSQKVAIKRPGPDSPPYIDYINKKSKGKKGRWYKPIKWWSN